MQGRRIELVRLDERPEDVVDPRQPKRDVKSVFPTSRDKLVDAAKELGIIRDRSAFVGGGESGKTPDAGNGPVSTAHFDGSACLAETLLKQRQEKQEARDAAIKASKVPVYDDEDHFFLDSVEEARQADARQRKAREDDALAEFKRMQNDAMGGKQIADEWNRERGEQGERGERGEGFHDTRRNSGRATRLVDRLRVKRRKAVEEDGKGEEHPQANSRDVEKDSDSPDDSKDGAVHAEDGGDEHACQGDVGNLFGCYGDDSDD